MRHVLSALVMNQPGVLAQISGMLASRAFNIDSLAVGASGGLGYSQYAMFLGLGVGIGLAGVCHRLLVGGYIYHVLRSARLYGEGLSGLSTRLLLILTGVCRGP